ncbi:metallophosphoesterase family protein [Ancylobacter radicis]|nr:metallophosphoesterase family protein [Ancylobacter radicis]
MYRIPEGERVYATGDIHGRYDLLSRLLDDALRDMGTGAAGVTSQFVFLGDYIDRGADTRRVLDCLIKGRSASGWVCLKGNHEAMLLDALDGRRDWSSWLANGGVETLFSYGLLARDYMTAGRTSELREAVLEAMPAEHLAFLRDLPASHVVGGYFFCHAGIRPGLPLDRQTEDDLLWIRDVFVDSGDDHGKRIVHGHTPVMVPDVRPNRVNVDTGAYLTHRLSCAVLEGPDVRFLHT